MLALVSTVLAAVAPSDTLLQLTLGGRGRYALGDHAPVEVRPAAAGHLLVLQADPDGTVRVLFPLRPTDETYAVGAAAYQLRGRAGARGALAVMRPGRGVVLAALSPRPLHAMAVTLHGQWDPLRLRARPGETGDAALRRIAAAVAGPSAVTTSATYEGLADGRSAWQARALAAAGMGRGGAAAGRPNPFWQGVWQMQEEHQPAFDPMREVGGVVRQDPSGRDLKSASRERGTP